MGSHKHQAMMTSSELVKKFVVLVEPTEIGVLATVTDHEVVSYFLASDSLAHL